jgi:ABC-2 type transport system permease protein
MRRFYAIIKKELRQIRRDRLSLGLLIFIPALLLVMYGYALSFDIKHIRVAVLDHDRTDASRRLQDSLFQNPYFERAGTLANESEADRILMRRQARAVLVIPADYSATLARGEKTVIQALVDGADATTASTTVGYLEAMGERLSQQARADAAKRTGASGSLPVVNLQPRLWFNPDLDSAKFLVPGLIGMLLMLSAVIATSLSIVREKERETMEQIMVSPVKPWELILGKTLPYAGICLLTMVMILFIGYALFGVVVQGSFLLLGVSTLVFLFASLGMGILISSVTNSQQVAFQISTLVSLLPSMLLSGLIFPIKNMPLVIQGITMLVAPRFFVSALRGIIIKGASWSVVWPDLMAMLALGLLFNYLAVRNLRKSL